MLNLAIEPQDLVHKTLSEFTKPKQGDGAKVPEHISKLRYKTHLRQIIKDKEAILHYKIKNFKEKDESLYKRVQRQIKADIKK